MNTNQANIDRLVDRIEQARAAYYNATPVMTDAAYDLLEDELRRLDSNHPALKTIGAPVPSVPTGPLAGGGWPKVKHTIPMASLNKAQVEADMVGWYTGCNTTAQLVVMDKLDGLSVGLEYDNRQLVRALTRGDGTTGEDITRNVLLMKGAVKMLPPTMPNGLGGSMPTPAKVFVRGEMVVTHADFKQHFPGESNPRNTASGTAKRQTDPAKCAYVTVIAYNLMPNGSSMASKSEELWALTTIGFIPPAWSVAGRLADVYAVYADYVAHARKSIGYDIDGLVIEVDNAATREGLGDLNGRPRGACAYKFPHESKPTILRDIRWQVGSSGRITPVVEFDAVQLAGAMVKQASLHNISYMKALVTDAQGVGEFPCVGDQVLVSRRNDVIPYVESLLTQATKPSVEFRPPTECPSCKATLVRDGEYLVCRNEDCEAQASGSVKRWIKKVGVLHVGDSLVESMIEAGLVADAADLYILDANEVANLEIGGRRVGATGDKAVGNLNAKKTMSVATFVGSVGIPLIGRSMAQTIADGGFDTLSKMLKAKIVEIAAVPGVGQVKAEAFVVGFQAKAGLMAKLLANGITISQASGDLLGQVIAFTGFRDAALKDALEAQGATVKDSASKSTTYLVALDKNGNSGKLQLARKNGTKVIDADDAWALVGGKI